MPNVVKVQAGYKRQPLSAYLGKPAPAAAARLDFQKINKDMVKENFFQYLDFALQFAPAGPEEKEIRAKLASIGIGPGKKFDFKELSLEHKAAVGLGMKQGSDKVDQYVAGICTHLRQRRDAAGERVCGTSRRTRRAGATGNHPGVVVAD